MVSFGYDARGRRTSVTDGNGKLTQYAYDDADRLISVTDADNHVTQYGYDAENILTSITDANLHTTTFAYDALRRLAQLLGCPFWKSEQFNGFLHPLISVYGKGVGSRNRIVLLPRQILFGRYWKIYQ